MQDFPRYESYKNSGVEWLGAIPSHWDVRRNIGLFDERKEVNKPDMDLLSVTINRGVIKQSEIMIKKDSSNEDKSKYKVVRKSDLAYNKMRMWQGAIGISNYDGIVSPAYIILKAKGKAYSKFFHYLYRTQLFIKEANRHSYGLCDDMNSLRYEDFRTMYSPVPPQKDAGRIVDFLDRKTTERVANVQFGYFKLDHMAELKLPKRIADQYLVKTGDILVTEGGDIDKLGRGTVWGNQIPGCLHQNHIFAIRINRGMAIEHFVSLSMGVDYGRKYFTHTANKTTNLASTNKTKLGNLPVVLPPVKEQKEIVNHVNSLSIEFEKTISIISKEIETLHEFNCILISEAVTGKIKI